MNIKFKKVLSSILIMAMAMTSASFRTFAEGISEIIQNQTTNANGEDLLKKYIEEGEENEKRYSIDDSIEPSNDEEEDVNKMLKEDEKEDDDVDSSSEEEENSTDSSIESASWNLEENVDSSINTEKSIETIDEDNFIDDSTKSINITTSTDSDFDFDEVLDDIKREDDDVEVASDNEIDTKSCDMEKTNLIVTPSELGIINIASSNEIEMINISSLSDVKTTNNDTLFGARSKTKISQINPSFTTNGSQFNRINSHLNLPKNWYERYGFTLPKDEIKNISINLVSPSSKDAVKAIPDCDEYVQVDFSNSSTSLPDVLVPAVNGKLRGYIYRVDQTIYFEFFMNRASTGIMFTCYYLCSNESKFWAGWSGLKSISIGGI